MTLQDQEKSPGSVVEVRRQKNPWSPIEFGFASSMPSDECGAKLLQHFRDFKKQQAKRFGWTRAIVGDHNTIRYGVSRVGDGVYIFEFWSSVDYWKIFGELRPISDTQTYIQGTAFEHNTKWRFVTWFVMNVFWGILCTALAVSADSPVTISAAFFAIGFIMYTYQVYLPLRRAHPMIKRIRRWLA